MELPQWQIECTNLHLLQPGPLLLLMVTKIVLVCHRQYSVCLRLFLSPEHNKFHAVVNSYIHTLFRQYFDNTFQCHFLAECVCVCVCMCMHVFACVCQFVKFWMNSHTCYFILSLFFLLFFNLCPIFHAFCTTFCVVKLQSTLSL